MTHLEHFIYASFNGVGYRTVKTDGVDKLLTTDMMNELKELEDDTVTWFYRKCLALTHVDRAADEYGRKTVWNHTILLSPDNIHSLFSSYFVNPKTTQIPTLKPLEVEIK